MDAFLSQSNYAILYQWFKNHFDDYEEKSDEWAFSLIQTHDQFQVYVHFYKSGVIEEFIKSTDDSSVLYYIHFQFLNFSQSTSMLKELLFFVDKLKQKKKHVLICCSCGLTSSLFQEGLQKVIDENNFNLDISASDIYSLKHKYEDYDLILLTPQVSHFKPKLMKEIKKPIMIIPTSDFACHNYANTLSIINHLLDKENSNEKNIISM